MDECQRLYAVVGSILGDRRAELVREKSLVQKARKHLADLRSVAASGGQCDLAG